MTPEQLDVDFKTSDKSVRETLVHIFRAERMWLSRLKGPVVDFRSEGDDSMPELFARWPDVIAR